jgi:RHH-type rel operon transcriptional repressor/antitoxin RelB
LVCIACDKVPLPWATYKRAWFTFKKSAPRHFYIFLANFIEKEHNVLYALHPMEESIMTYSIRLPHEIEDRLESLSVLTGRSKSFYVKEAIIEHLDDIEDVYLAEKRLEDIRAGRTQTIPLKQVMKHYGMDN